MFCALARYDSDPRAEPHRRQLRFCQSISELGKGFAANCRQYQKICTMPFSEFLHEFKLWIIGRDAQSVVKIEFKLALQSFQIAEIHDPSMFI